MQEFIKIARMRKRFLRNIIFRRNQGDVLKCLVITAFIAGFWVFAYFLFERAFVFLENFPGIGDLIKDRLIYVVFGIISIMLLVSTAILSYSKLYKSRETEYLFSLPVSSGAVFSYKSLESILISSWASIFLISPLLAAYGKYYSRHWLYYGVSAFIYIPFIIICGILGILITGIAVRVFNIYSLKRIGGAAAAGSAGFILYLNFTSGAIIFEQETSAAINRLMSHTNIFLSPFLPSFWMGEGLLSMNRLDMRNTVIYSAMLLSTALVFMLVIQRAGRKYYPSWWFSVRDKSSKGRGMLTGIADRLAPLISFLPARRTAFLMKDIKIFLRDPQQWTQAFLFSGLLLIYILNLRRMPVDMESFYWRRLVYFLNFSALITILAMTSVRFAFPSISIEGKRFWITLLSPVSLDKLVMEKFYLTGVILSFLGLILTVSINYVLKAGAGSYLLSSAFTIMVSFTLSGLAVGIGAMFPDFKEDSISKISSGFGATLTLIVSLAYMILVIATIAVPVFKRDPFQELPVLFAVGAVITAVSLICMLLPLKLGIRHLNNSDF